MTQQMAHTQTGTMLMADGVVSYQRPRLSRIRRLYLIEESMVYHDSCKGLAVRAIVGRYLLLGVFLFVISLASTLSLAVRYGYGKDMVFR